MKKYKLFIFDCDGTLIDSKSMMAYAIKEVAHALNLREVHENKISKYTGMGLPETVRNLFPEVDFELFHQTFHNFYTAEKLSQNFFPETTTILQKLKSAGATLAMATNIIRKKTNLFLQVSNLADIFSTNRCGDDAFLKPHPEVVLSILNELRINANDAVMIGDSVYDMQLAQNAGVDAIAVAYGNANVQKLMTYRPVAFIHHIREILNFG